MESLHFHAIPPATNEFAPTEMETHEDSRDILMRIHFLLDTFTLPNPNLIFDAKKYIEALKAEGAVKTEDDSEPFKKSLLEKLYRKFRGCVGCGGGVMSSGSRHDNVLQPHHILPSEFGGKAIRENAMLVCRNCHIKIHN